MLTDTFFSVCATQSRTYVIASMIFAAILYTQGDWFGQAGWGVDDSDCTLHLDLLHTLDHRDGTSTRRVRSLTLSLSLSLSLHLRRSGRDHVESA